MLERGQIIGMRQCGKSFVAIGQDLGINCDTVRKVWNHYPRTGMIVPLRRPGRPTILTDRDRRVIKRYVKSGREERRTALSDITAKYNIKISEDTLLHELQKLNLNHRIERKKPYLRPAQKEA
jgi:transposase